MFLQLLATCLSLHLSGHQVSCSNAASFQPALARPARSWIFELTRPCWTLPLQQRSGPSSASMTGMTDLSLAPHCAAAVWDDLALCQCLSKRLSQTCIAVILVWCDKHVPGIGNISKTGHFHPCIGSRTNWPRVNCWRCTLQYFICPWQESNKMDQSSFHCSWLALGAQSKGCFPSCFPHMCHGLAFSVSSINAALCSCQPAAFGVHLRSGWYGACFKPKALRVPGTPLRPYGSASGFSGPCRSTCWCNLAKIACHRAAVES